MKTVIATILISALTLGLTTMSIELWRNNMDLINLSAAKVDQREKIKATSLLSLEESSVLGSEVISVLRYYDHHENLSIQVTVGGNTKEYAQEDYDPEIFPIAYEDRFTVEKFYEENQLTKISYTQNN